MSEKEKKSKLDPKTRQIIDVVVTAIQVVIVIFCIVLSIIIWTGSAGDPINRKINWFAIRTDSMTRQSDDFYAKFKSDYNCDFDVKKTTFNPGDMVITKKVAFEDIHVGDVIAYTASVKDGNGNISEQIVTHRVYSINTNDHTFSTRGDKDVNGEDPTLDISYKNVYGKMTGKLAGIGGAVLWLQGYRKVTMADGSEAYDYSGSSVTFLVIIIPLAALFIYNGFYVVKWVMDERMKKVKEAAQKEAADQAAKESVNQKELERKAIRAFMTAQGMTDEQIDEYFAKEDAKEAAKLAEQQAQEQAQEEEQGQEQAEPSEATQEQSEEPEQTESESQETPQD
jgi:hypothetical protein